MILEMIHITVKHGNIDILGGGVPTISSNKAVLNGVCVAHIDFSKVRKDYEQFFGRFVTPLNDS